MLKILTSIGLTGVEGKGCRYSGCRMCPDRAVSIFKSLMGTRCACRAGSDGGAGWRKGLLTPLFRELLLCQAAQWSLYFRADADGVVIMSQLSAEETVTLSSDTLRKSKKYRALIFRKDKKKKESPNGRIILVVKERGAAAGRSQWRVIADPRLRLSLWALRLVWVCVLVLTLYFRSTNW